MFGTTKNVEDDMEKIQEIYDRKIRDELGRYPNLLIQTPVTLGSAGLYNGRHAEFDRVCTLSALGISVAPLPSQTLMDELYTTIGLVYVDFEVAAAANKAGFRFKKALAVATQGYKTSYEVMPIGPFEQAIVKAIKDGLVYWNMDWVIVTELWRSVAFTTLISGAKGAAAEISTSQTIPGGVFNVADINVGVKPSRSNAMGYHGVAEGSVTPPSSRFTSLSTTGTTSSWTGATHSASGLTTRSSGPMKSSKHQDNINQTRETKDTKGRKSLILYSVASFTFGLLIGMLSGLNMSPFCYTDYPLLFTFVRRAA